jgi:hypothetical protein
MWQQGWRRRLWRGASGSDMADGQLIHHLLFNKLPRILTAAAAVGPFRWPLRSALADNTSCRQQQPDGNVALKLSSTPPGAPAAPTLRHETVQQHAGVQLP